MQRACATFTLCLLLGEPPPVCHTVVAIVVVVVASQVAPTVAAHLSAPSSVDCTFYLRIYLHIFSHGSSPAFLPAPCIPSSPSGLQHLQQLVCVCCCLLALQFNCPDRAFLCSLFVCPPFAFASAFLCLPPSLSLFLVSHVCRLA